MTRTIKLEGRNGAFFARCTLRASPDIEMWGIVDSGASVTFLAPSMCDRARLKYKGTQDGVVCVHGKRHADLGVRFYRAAMTLGNVTVNDRVYEYDGKLGFGGIQAHAILGRNILCNFDVNLGWLDGKGVLESRA